MHYEIYSAWKKIKSSYNNNRFQVSVLTWNDKFKLTDGSYSVSNIQDHLEPVLKRMEKALTIHKYIKMGMLLKFKHQKQLNYLETLKKNKERKNW